MSWFVVPGLRRRDIGVDVAAAAMYVVNWVFARRETDYLASDVLPSPVQHFWSLAVEEQFYVIWPLLLIVLALVVRRPSRRVVALALGALVASSFVWSVWFSHTSPRPAFFTTTTRVWELGIGALLAVALAGRPRPTTAARGSAALGWAALVALVAVALWLPQDIDWPGAWALLPTLPTAVLLWVGWQGPARGPVRVLGTAPMVWVGGLSYSIYLWHWPVIILGGWTAEAFGTTLPAWGLVVLALASVVPAWLSWRFVESPIHHGPWLRDRPRALLAAGARPVLRRRARRPAAVPAALALHDHAAGRRPAAAVAARRRDAAARASRSPPVDDPGWVTPDPLVSGEDRPKADVDHCQVPVDATTPVACTFGDPQGTTTVALVGDSKAMQWLPALEEAAATRGWRVVTYGKSSCAFSDAPAAQAGAAYPRVRRVERAPSWTPCAPTRPTSSSPPGVAASAWTGSGTSARPLVDGYASRWTTLADAGVPVVVVGDSPRLARRPRRLRGAAPERADPLLLRHGIRRRPQRSGGAARGGRRGIRDGCRRAPARPHRARSARGSSAPSSSGTWPCTGPVTTSPRRTPRRSPRRWPPRSRTPSRR